MDKRGGQGMIVEPAMGATLKSHAHKFDSDKKIVILSAYG